MIFLTLFILVVFFLKTSGELLELEVELELDPPECPELELDPLDPLDPLEPPSELKLLDVTGSGLNLGLKVVFLPQLPSFPSDFTAILFPATSSFPSTLACTAQLHLPRSFFSRDLIVIPHVLLRMPFERISLHMH